MTRGQRRVVLAFLLLAAALLHFSLFVWAFRTDISYTSFLSVDESSWVNSGRLARTGIFYRAFGNGAILLGAFTPLLFLSLALWLHLGWRRADRVRLGGCLACGHQLCPPASNPCPECGADSGSRSGAES